MGIIGASAQGGWARDSHVPAVQALSGLEFSAVATNSRKTADAAARAFGVASAYSSGQELVRADDVDLVTVTTRVPDHLNLVLAAIAAGKHVYCEWPLGRDTSEAEQMSAAARKAGVHAAVGLQLRGNPVVPHARAMLASGAIGRLLSLSMYSTTAGFGPNVPAPFAYLEQPENFANLVTIQGAHTIDLAIAVAGGLTDLSALTTRQYSEIMVGDGAERQPRTTFDHLLLQSRLATGGALSIEVAGGRPPETPFRLEAVGEAGNLRLDGGSARGFQSGRLTLALNGVPQRVNEGELSSMSDAAANVAGVYAMLRDDIRNGTDNAVDFSHAVKLTRLVADLLESSRTGRRKFSADWPTR